MTEGGKLEQHASGGSTSRSLLSEARLANSAAWERLVTLYAPLVASWCRRGGVSEQDVVDVLQEVFSAVSTHLDRFRKEQPADTFRGWLATISRNKVRDYFYRKSREPAATGGTEASLRIQQILDRPAADNDSSAGKEDAGDDLLLSGVLLSALDAIRGEFHERTWQAFWKVVVEGRAAADVAADLDMRPGTVRVCKSRVLLRLRRELGDIGE